MSRADRYKIILMDRLKDLDVRLHDIEHELDEPQSADDEERATEREGDEVLEQLGNAGLKEIEQIQAALGRIREGTFGDCAKCGQEISDERLGVLPQTPFCRVCA